MESRRILVFGLPDGTSKPQLIKHFQSKRVSGRGDVESIDLADSGQAVITFSDAEAATRVLQQGYRQRFQNCLLQVALLPEQAPTRNKEDNLDDASMESDESSSDSEEDGDDRRHEWFDNPSMVQNDIRRKADASATAAAMKGTATAKTTQINNAQTEQCTVKVTGLPDGASEDLVWNYFENTRRSKGGLISSVIMEPELQMCLVTFESGDDAKRTVEHPSHTLDGVRVEVSFQDDPEDEPGTLDSIDETTLTIIVHGISPRSTEDGVINYFENYRRSGGGEICDIEYSEGAALITFAEVKDAQRLLERSHSIDGKDVTVVKQPPKKKVPPDPLRVLVKGLNDRTSEDCLRFYLEKFCDEDVVEVYFGCDNNALATFAAEPDFSRLFDEVSKDCKGLEGAIPDLERVPMCSCILVTGLKEETTDDTIHLYFENTRRSGGNEVSRVEKQGKDQALVYFEDPSSVENVIRRHHVLEQVELSVWPYHHFLKESVPEPVGNKTEIKFDPDVIAYIQTSHSTELQTLLEDNYANLSADPENSTVTISISNNEGCNQQWHERTETLKQFLNTFTKVKFNLVSELFDEIKQRWQCPQNSTERQGDALVSFDVGNRFVQIIGKTEYVEKVTQELRELIRAAEEDSEVKKSIIQLVEDGIPRARLTLLQMSGFCERLQNEHQHLSISVDLENKKLWLEGPRKLLQDVTVEAFKFTTKIVEKILKLPIEVVEVLKRPAVSIFVQKLLEQNGIQAIVLCDQTMSPNEVQIVGVNLDSTSKAENLVQYNVQERSLHLTPENCQVLEGRGWKDVKVTLISKFKVGITLPTSSSTVWVRGIGKDVNECMDEIAQFLNVNTILKRLVPLEQGFASFLFHAWESKLYDIKKELSNCSVDMREAPTGDGIEICGTSEGLEKCMPKIRKLIKTIQRDSIPVRDKPRMKKLFSQGTCANETLEEDVKEREISKTSVREFSEYKHMEKAGDFDAIAGATLKTNQLEINMAGTVCASEEAGSFHECPICLDTLTHPQNLKCGHAFCAQCLQKALKVSSLCPVCQAPKSDAKGNQPPGEMKVRRESYLSVLPDYEGHSASSVAPSPENYETTPKMMAYLFKEYGNELKEMEKKDQVTISRKDDENKTYVCVTPGETSTVEELENACDSLITLYQRVHQNTRLERFSLKSEKTVVDSRKKINEIRKKSAVLVESTGDRKHWEIYGEKDVVEAALKDLKKNVGIKRDDTGSGNAKAENVTPREKRDYEEAMAINQPRSGVIMKRRLETTIGKVKLSVFKGDITNERVDVIVSAANSNLRQVGDVAEAIHGRGGKSIQNESKEIVRNKGKPRNGEAVATGAGNLSCKMLVHAVGNWRWETIGATNSKTVLRRACLNSFRVTEDQKMTSVALPAIGSGIYGMPKDVCAKVMFDAVEEFVRVGDLKTKTITDIRFVNIDDPTAQAFKNEFMARYAANTEEKSVGRNKDLREEEERKDEGMEIIKSMSNPEHPSREKRGKGDNWNTSDSTSGLASCVLKCAISPDALKNQAVLKGSQPPGKMTSEHEWKWSIPGYEGFGIIVIYYNFPSGTQGPEHPSPGQRYEGTGYTAYLPGTPEGYEVLELLRRAFDARLVFTIGALIATGLQNQVVWNGIQHKTRRKGGPQQFGYPDPDYLRRVKEDLAAKGIR